MYQESEGKVVITLDHYDYSNLLLCMGYASGSAMKNKEFSIADSFLQLANSVNLGNPDWKPYGEARSAAHVDLRTS